MLRLEFLHQVEVLAVVKVTSVILVIAHAQMLELEKEYLILSMELLNGVITTLFVMIAKSASVTCQT